MSHPMFAAPKKSLQPHEVPHTAYQVDFVAANCGKLVSASKRRIRFKFGYSNIEAISNGLTGQECRGSEHEIVVTWSLSSGKQAVAVDGREVFFDVGDTTKMNHSWQDKDGNTLQVKLHAAPVSTKANPDPDWKQYDLLINRISFFRMPKIYEIGIFPKNEGSPNFAKKFPNAATQNNEAKYFTYDEPVRSENRKYETPSEDHTLPIEQEQPKQERVPEPEPVEVFDLLSFDDNNSSPPVAPAPAQYAQNNYAPEANFYAAPAPTVSSVYNQGPSQYTQSYAPSANPFNAPAPAFANTQAPQQTSYAPTTHTVITPTASPGNSEPMYSNYQINGAPPAMQNTTTSYAPAPVAQPPVNSFAMVPAETTPQGVDGVVNKLVNLDDLFGTSSGPITKQSVDQKMQDINAHRPLGELKGNSNNNAPKKPVMNTFNATPTYPHQGMYGMQQQQQQQQPQQQYNNYGFQQNNQQGYAQYQ